MEYSAFIEKLRESFALSEEQKRQFALIEELYRQWNEKINVVSRKDIDFLLSHHVLHSLAIAHFAPFEKGSSVLDLGTGGGFPGIPLAILRPDCNFTLCDSIRKKTLVAGAISQALGLKNVTIVNARAESLPETFDYVVSRAVASLEDFMPWVNGKYSKEILYLKGGNVEEEISEAKIARWRVNIHRISSWLDDPYFEEKYVLQIRSKE